MSKYKICNSHTNIYTYNIHIKCKTTQFQFQFYLFPTHNLFTLLCFEYDLFMNICWLVCGRVLGFVSLPMPTMLYCSVVAHWYHQKYQPLTPIGLHHFRQFKTFKHNTISTLSEESVNVCTYVCVCVGACVCICIMSPLYHQWSLSAVPISRPLVLATELTQLAREQTQQCY